MTPIEEDQRIRYLRTELALWAQRKGVPGQLTEDQVRAYVLELDQLLQRKWL